MKHCNYNFYGKSDMDMDIIQTAIHAKKTKTTCNTFGNWWVDRGQVKYDQLNGHYNCPEAALQHYYETPYYLCNFKPNDHDKLTNWDKQNLDPSWYRQEGVYKQEETGYRDRNQFPLYTDFVPESYNLSETQMLAPTIHSTKQNENYAYPCGGYYTVDTETRQGIKKDYYMSASNGFYDMKTADYVAKNLMMPMGISVVHYL